MQKHFRSIRYCWKSSLIKTKRETIWKQKQPSSKNPFSTKIIWNFFIGILMCSFIPCFLSLYDKQYFNEYINSHRAVKQKLKNIDMKKTNAIVKNHKFVCYISSWSDIYSNLNGCPFNCTQVRIKRLQIVCLNQVKIS